LVSVQEPFIVPAESEMEIIRHCGRGVN
jgi:hypothetical protein